MTFTEAAVQVLRLVGKPLHYKEITDVAIEKELLSHVGKSPEVTMGARLAAVVKKTGPENPLTRVKPGVFALAEWDQQTIDQGLNDRTPALRKLAKLEAEKAASPPEGASDEAAAEGEVAAAPRPVEPSHLGQDEIARAELTAAATELFAPEEDDDEPLLGRDDEESDSEEESDDRGRRGRRRRRRGRGERDDDDLPSYTVSEASDDAIADVSAEAAKERGPERSQQARADRGERGGERERNRHERGERGERPEQKERGERNAERGERGERPERGERAERGAERGERAAERALERGDDQKLRPAAGDEASDLPFLVEQALGNHRRQGGAPFRQLADSLLRRVRGAGDAQQLSQWLAAACRTDNFRRQAAGDRPRFRLGANGRVGLWEWVIDRDQMRLEKEARVAIDRYQEVASQRLVKRLQELSPRAFGEFAQLLLEAQDFSQFRAVKRPAGNASESYLAATQRTLTGDLPVALTVRRDGRDVGREQVVELRGSLHYYGSVALGVIVTAGQVMSGAREEAQVTGATPVHFIDGARLARLCEQSGVGVVKHQLSVSLPDVDMFEALRAT